MCLWQNYFLITLIIFQYILLHNTANAENKSEIIYKYKQEDFIDLGSLEIKGEIIAPGDISVKERDRKVFSNRLYEKPDFVFVRRSYEW